MPPTTRSQARQDPTHNRRVSSKATATKKATAPEEVLHPYEWLTSPNTTKQDFEHVWQKMFKHKQFLRCNTHLSVEELAAVTRRHDFDSLGAKPLFSPYADSSTHYSQLLVERGSGMRVSAHVFAVVYRLRFLEVRTKRLGPAELKQLLERIGSAQAYEASHLCSNYKGCGLDCNPWHLTLEPLEINQSRRTCHLRWAKNQFMANQPSTSSSRALEALTQRFYAEGDRHPPLEESATYKLDKTTPFCCTDLHDPPCFAYYGPLPAPIVARGMAADVADMTRKTRRATELEEHKREEEEERAQRRARRTN